MGVHGTDSASSKQGLCHGYLGSPWSPSRYSSGYAALRECPGSVMPSGGDTGSMPSSLLPRPDVLLGSGDLMEMAPQLEVEFHPAPRPCKGGTLLPTAGFCMFPCEGPGGDT